MKSYINQMSFGVLVAFAAASEAISKVPNAAIVSGGQIALTARNNGDGTWSVTAGPGGMVLRDGLPKEKAIAIVGAPTGPYNPTTVEEGGQADLRVEAEQKLVDQAAVDVLKSDEELGLVDEGLANRSVKIPGTDQPQPGARTSPKSQPAHGAATFDARQTVGVEASDNSRQTGGPRKGTPSSGQSGKEKNGGE